MTMELREEIARRMCALVWPDRDQEELCGGFGNERPHKALWKNYLPATDAALSVIQARSSVQPGVDGLLPCAHCGGPARTRQERDRRIWFVQCDDCDARIAGHIQHDTESAKPYAEAVWNTRSPPSNPGRWQLSDLYNDLNKLRWTGADEGWDLAIKAVRADIAKRLGLPPDTAGTEI